MHFRLVERESLAGSKAQYCCYLRRDTGIANAPTHQVRRRCRTHRGDSRVGSRHWSIRGRCQLTLGGIILQKLYATEHRSGVNCLALCKLEQSSAPSIEEIPPLLIARRELK